MAQSKSTRSKRATKATSTAAKSRTKTKSTTSAKPRTNAKSTASPKTRAKAKSTTSSKPRTKAKSTTSTKSRAKAKSTKKETTVRDSARELPAPENNQTEQQEQDVATVKPEESALMAGPIELETRLSIKNVLALNHTLESALKADRPIVIDVSAVQAIDISALQVLVAFSNTASAQSRDIQWQGNTDTLKKYCQLADLDRHLSFESMSVTDEDDGLCPVF